MKQYQALQFTRLKHPLLYLLSFYQEQTDDSKVVLAKLSKLRYEMKTDKQLMLIEDDQPDADIWNDTIKNSKSLVEETKIASSFTGAWLTVECYMYRKIYEAFALRSVQIFFFLSEIET